MTWFPRALTLFAALSLAACASVAPAPPPASPVPAADEPPPLATADTVKAPVWIKRGKRRKAVLPGDAVQAGDTLITGPGGHVQVRMDDASTVKLGENAELGVPRLSKGNSGVLRGTLSVVKGAFRYTTSALGKLRKRDMTVNIGGIVTAGIRGTDIWGKSGDGQNLVCLIDGAIEVASPQAPPVQMKDARTVYVVPDGKPPEPVTAVAADKLEGWVRQTEIPEGAVAQTANGPWALSLMSVRTDEQAARSAARLEKRGYAVKLETVDVDGTEWQRVLLPGFRTAGDARKVIPVLEEELKQKGMWVPQRVRE